MQHKVNFSVAASLPLTEDLKSRSDREQLGMTAKRDLERYYQLLAATPTPVMTIDRAVVIVNALNGVRIDSEILPSGIIANIIGAIEIDSEGIELIGWLKSLSAIELFKIIDASERFWIGDYSIQDTNRKLLEVGLISDE